MIYSNTVFHVIYFVQVPSCYPNQFYHNNDVHCVHDISFCNQIVVNENCLYTTGFKCLQCFIWDR